jgi:hypothetical protein
VGLRALRRASWERAGRKVSRQSNIMYDMYNMYNVGGKRAAQASERRSKKHTKKSKRQGSLILYLHIKIF